MLKILRPSILITLSLTACVTQSAFAQSSTGVAAEGIRIFGLAYFDEFDPVSAMDLVQRMPGFNPQEESEGRGLSGVRSNMLINGERQPPKGKNAWQRLNDMPYTNVERIELIDAGASDIDMQGYSQVINVILKEDRENFYELFSRYVKSGTGDPDQINQKDTRANVSALVYLGEHEISLRGGGRNNNNREPGDIVDIDPANPEQRISSLNQTEQEEQFFEAGAVFRLPADSSLTVNAQLFQNEWASNPVLLVEETSVDAVNQNYSNENDWQEVSGEYKYPLGNGSEVLVAVLDSVSKEGSESTLVFDDLNRSSVRNTESGETAGRIRLTRKLTDSLTVRTTASTAYNYFEGDFQVFEDGKLIPLDGSDSRVEEDRHALEVDADWSFTDDWVLSGALTAGTYAIDTHDSSTGTQFESKGYASLSWHLQDRTTITMESTREIGQLSFGQFLASSNLSSEILQAGADSLEPEAQWFHELSYDRRFGDRGVIRLSLAHLTIENPVQSVALTDTLVVSQNSNAAKVAAVEASVDYPFEAFGFSDLMISTEVTLRESNTIDPITNVERDVSWAAPYSWSLELRRLPGESDWNWGVDFSTSARNDYYSLRSSRTQSNERRWDAYVEWEFMDGFKLRGNVEGPRTTTRLTTYYPGIRQVGLTPSFYATTTNRVDRSSSLSLEWRKDNNLEIRAIYSPRPRFRSEEELLGYGETMGTTLAREIAESPRMDLRFRLSI